MEESKKRKLTGVTMCYSCKAPEMRRPLCFGRKGTFDRFSILSEKTSSLISSSSCKLPFAKT
ncbi:hypothetical protein HPP92_017239 [Vanilla planifolia]|uniref:Uncharacterized protein n=1 Tax=Vanilla planifolia TaxID=51239 RepID=A0A835QBV6_VANPL|nr:hypothetical protein HPP92_017239 [Vanilla planifolia]